jgi:hypothetical protein
MVKYIEIKIHHIYKYTNAFQLKQNLYPDGNLLGMSNNQIKQRHRK